MASQPPPGLVDRLGGAPPNFNCFPKPQVYALRMDPEKRTTLVTVAWSDPSDCWLAIYEAGNCCQSVPLFAFLIFWQAVD